MKYAGIACLLAASFLLTDRQARAETARFTVRDTVVNPDLPAFDATVTALGNGADLMPSGGGFEPSNFRTMLIAEQDSPNSILASREVISSWDSWPEGMLDGADIEVLRVVNGKMETIRRSRVPEGGFHASGWLGMLRDGKVIAPEQTRYVGSWDSFNRLGGAWYYMVRAVDASGRLSPPSATVSVTAPQKPGKVEGDMALADVKLAGNSGGSLPAPENVQAKLTISRTLMLTWDPVPGAAGYVVYRSDLPPERHRGYSIDLDGQGPDIRAGDMVLVRKRFDAPRREQVATNRIWRANATSSTFGVPLLPGFPGDPDVPDYRLIRHDPGTPVTDPGETYLEADLRNGQPLILGLYNHSGTGQDYYPVLDPAKTYRFEVWLRTKGEATAAFRINGPLSKTPGLPAAIQVGKDWQRHVVDFRVPSAFTGSQAGQMQLVLSGTGPVDVDNFRIYQADTPFMDLLPEDREALELSGLGALRSHQFVRTKARTYDLTQLTEPAGVSPKTVGGNTLPQFLSINASLGMSPWLQIEPHLSREEWLGLAEYLAAPFDPAKDDPKALPWAAKRVAQGHAAPWTDTFGHIYFELGNETWNALFRPWVFPSMTDGARLNWSKYNAGEVYGLYQEHVLSILRESPWWDRLAPRLEPVLGGWQINNYGFSALKHAPDSRFQTVADYIGGWDSGEGPVRPSPEGYASVMMFTPQVTERHAAASHQKLRDAGLEGKVGLGTYEAGPGYALNGLNNSKVTPEQKAEQEKVMKSAAAGAATLDNFLARAQAGDRIQNFFTFGRGTEWASHARWNKGGQSYPSWDWLTLFNRVGRGDILAVDTQVVSRRDVPEMGRRKPAADVAETAVYAARKGNRLTVTVISRKVPGVPAGSDGKTALEVDLPISGAARLTRYRATGDYRSENTISRQTQIIPEQIPVPADPARLEIPDLAPASAEIYVFDDVTFRE
ncbi:hypothetical protein D2T29_13675 [Sinirhodobacter populi]|uniref:CBM6 domain-containing protein n=1 Tax=Paenirhodobacter populi TaxID=2306993 RepID=A0A443KAX9_9RHOB|nr:hypothetical protein [Sinirhodobacter populi]RWR29832.1 hypothetical protein D2T29_13675 [Sinirhodobacter populi]